MAQFSFKQAKRRYQLLFWPVMGIYVVACIGGAVLQRQFDSNPVWLSAGLAVLTTLPIFGFLALLWRYVMETDEFTRLMQLESLAIGGLVTVGVIGLIGFLEIYGAIPGFPVFLIMPFFFVSYGAAKWFRGRGACV